jgi:outer membrane receptor for ferrienterochelin and colicins
MKKHLSKLILFCGAIFLSSTIHAQTTVSGVITDAESGEVLIGANVIILGSTIGTTSDFDGNYSITSDQALPWSLEVSFTGFTNQTIEITEGGTQNIVLTSGIKFNQEVVISASRKKEKAVDAPASISVLSAARLSVVADGGNVVNGLKNTVGVSVIDQGIDRSAIQLRGSAIVNSNRVQVYRDNRPMTQLSQLNFESQLTPISPIDIKQVEVLRGPAGALYGPGVDAGVVHFITKDPWDEDGTTVSLTAGEQSLLKFDIRHAGAVNDKFGYKILLGGMTAQDFQIEATEALDVQANQWGGATTMNGEGFLEGETLTHNGNLIKDVGNRYGTAALYFKPKDNISITATYDYGQFKGNRRNAQGDIYAKQTAHNIQLKGQIGSLFLAYNNLIIPGTKEGKSVEDTPSYNANYANGLIQPTGKEVERKLEIQYPFSAGPVDVTVGGDYLSTDLIDDFARAGRNANQPYAIYGGYLQAKYNITSKLTVNAVARLDQFDAFDQSALSPRAALIYKPTSSSQIRMSYNRSFSAMNPVRTFLDFNLRVLPNGLMLRAVGGGSGIAFTNPTAYGLPFAQGINGASIAGDQISLEAILNNGAVMGALNAAGIDVAALTAAVSGQNTDLSYVTFRDEIPVSSLAGYGAAKAKLTTTNTFEIGYKGVVADKFAVQVDIYNNRIENFESNATPITPWISAPSLGADLAAAANAVGLDGAAVAAAINRTPFGNGSNIGIAESDFSQTRPDGQLPHINFGFLNFGEASYWGYDLGLEYYVNPEISVFTNYSGLSKNEFSLEDLGEAADSGFPPQFLNTPKNRVRLGINYIQPSGLFGSVAMSYNEEYNAVSGIFLGTVDARTLVDLTVGYVMNNGLKATLGVSNLLNNEYNYFPRLPQITRVATLNVQYHFGGKK